MLDKFDLLAPWEGNVQKMLWRIMYFDVMVNYVFWCYGVKD